MCYLWIILSWWMRVGKQLRMDWSKSSVSDEVIVEIESEEVQKSEWFLLFGFYYP